jgi:hypothetical protein
VSQLHPIERAEALVASEPLLAVDAAVIALGSTQGHRSEQETAHYLDVLARAVLATRPDAFSDGGADPVSTMLAERKCDAISCAALLRLLVVDDAAFEDPRLRAANALFDRTLAGRLYRSLDLTEKAQAFAKRDRLRTHVANHETALLAHLDSLGSLDALQAFRQQFSKLFKDQTTQVAFVPFLPAGLTIQTFNEVLTAVQHAAHAEDEVLLETARLADQRCHDLAAQADTVPTVYSKSVVRHLAQTLSSLLQHLTRSRGLADPATLSLVPVAKHYPLRHAGSPVALRLDVINDGPGHAQEVTFTVEGQQHVTFKDASRTLGQLAPGTLRIAIKGHVENPAESDAALIRVSWCDPDRSEHAVEEILELTSQQRDVPWDTLEYEDPYPLEPVDDAHRFIGRERVLKDLAKIVLAATPGNARVEGQRRVGKTSIANALRSRVESLRPNTYCFLTTESGDFNANTAEATVERLGEAIVTRLRAADPRLAKLDAGTFSVGLSPLTECFEQALVLAPDRRFIVVLDEFDSLPHPELYGRGPVATAFFQTLRSLGGKRNVGFLLIGGERMRFVIANHGQALNKFQLVPVDYFGHDHYDDYQRLVAEPVAHWLDIAPEAVDVLHEASAGNPWITKLIARQLFSRAVASRDADVRQEEAVEAVNATVPRLGASSFQHFWDDAIQGEIDEQEFVSIVRRKVLLGLAACIREQKALTETSVSKAARQYGIDEVSALDALRGFRARDILREDSEGVLSCRVPIFGRWLADEGVSQIVVTMGDDDAIIRRERAQEAARPKIDELREVAERWRTYQGRSLTPDHLRTWLNQFGEASDQRLMLKLLQQFRYFNASAVREHLRDLHRYVLRDLAEAGYGYTMSGQQRSRGDLIVCGMQGGGSGAAALVKPYRDENRIYAERAIDAAAVPSAVAANQDTIRAVLIVEDLIGTGNTARKRLAEFSREWTVDDEWPPNLSVYLLAICGFDSAVDAVRKHVAQLDIPFQVHVATPLDNSDRCFHEASRLFEDPEDRDRARAFCAALGETLEPRHPLGHDDTQAAVAFEARCPNNTLPVVWKDAPNWQALLPRL